MEEKNKIFVDASPQRAVRINQTEGENEIEIVVQHSSYPYSESQARQGIDFPAEMAGWLD